MPLLQGVAGFLQAAAVRVLTQVPWCELVAQRAAITSTIAGRTLSAMRTVDQEQLDSRSMLGFLRHVADHVDADRWKLYSRMLACVYLVKLLERSGYFQGTEHQGLAFIPK